MEIKSFGIIYLMINKINNKVYIGQAINFKQRMYGHKYYSKKEKPVGRIINNITWKI